MDEEVLEVKDDDDGDGGDKLYLICQRQLTSNKVQQGLVSNEIPGAGFSHIHWD